MKDGLTIKEVSVFSGLSDHTLRYYERIGLLDHVERTVNGHRHYGTQDLAWIEFLNRLRLTGMPIKQMLEFAFYRRSGLSTLKERRLLLEKHEKTIIQQITDMQSNLEFIRTKILNYKKMEDTENEGQ